MKRVMFLIIAVLLVAVHAFAADTVSYSWTERNGIAVCTVSWVDDGGDGIASTTISSGSWAGYIIRAETDPGATAPTDNYDIVINSRYGADLFGGELNNRDTSNSEIAEPLIPYIYQDGTMYFVLTNNSQAGALGTLVIYVKPVGKP